MGDETLQGFSEDTVMGGWGGGSAQGWAHRGGSHPLHQAGSTLLTPLPCPWPCCPCWGLCTALPGVLVHCAPLCKENTPFSDMCVSQHSPTIPIASFSNPIGLSFFFPAMSELGSSEHIIYLAATPRGEHELCWRCPSSHPRSAHQQEPG